ncbi:hypothetical protein BpHYR1_012392 [Brachionus plicatilis]|uniref:Transmembrane protein n=1 Tax=Brachionus plicatilis TaxID=10195 RepID=A0A3M7R800_BRAPC|nr:hypothetical protein BpHYR1_012392 [Brachionus plicatilis]
MSISYVNFSRQLFFLIRSVINYCVICFICAELKHLQIKKQIVDNQWNRMTQSSCYISLLDSKSQFEATMKQDFSTDFFIFHLKSHFSSSFKINVLRVFLDSLPYYDRQFAGSCVKIDFLGIIVMLAVLLK